MVLHFGGSSIGIENNWKEYLTVRSWLLANNHSLSRDWLGKDRHTGLVSLFSETEKSISRSDGVILDATYDTHGIGIQLAIAVMYKRPVLMLARNQSTATLSQPVLINSADKGLIKSVTYKNQAKLETAISTFIDWIEDTNKLARFNIELDRKLDNYLKLKAKLNRSSKSVEIRRLIEQDLERHA